MADCFRSCGRPSVGKSTNHTLNKDTTGTSHRLACPSCPKASYEVHPGGAIGTRGCRAPGCRFGDTPSLLGWTTLRSPDWSTVVGSISRQTLRRPRRTAMTPIALLPSLFL
ncbi:hypothetical protein GGG16DRAFT_124071 [Schizophyllum commune]